MLMHYYPHVCYLVFFILSTGSISFWSLIGLGWIRVAGCIFGVSLLNRAMVSFRFAVDVCSAVDIVSLILFISFYLSLSLFFCRGGSLASPRSFIYSFSITCCAFILREKHWGINDCICTRLIWQFAGRIETKAVLLLPPSLLRIRTFCDVRRICIASAKLHCQQFERSPILLHRTMDINRREREHTHVDDESL